MDATNQQGAWVVPYVWRCREPLLADFRLPAWRGGAADGGQALIAWGKAVQDNNTGRTIVKMPFYG